LKFSPWLIHNLWLISFSYSISSYLNGGLIVVVFLLKMAWPFLYLSFSLRALLSLSGSSRELFGLPLVA
jgi:hypothetical protein